MASRHREQRIIATVGCPRCGAKRGDPCRVAAGPHEGLTAGVRISASAVRLVVHAERRQAWQRLRD